MRTLAIISLALVAAPVAAAPDTDWGRVVQNNVRAQLVDPEPAYAGILMEGSSGRLGSRGWSRYQSDTVKPLRSLSGNSTLGASGGGGGGGGGNSGGGSGSSSNSGGPGSN
jgi:hypothetical protein